MITARIQHQLGAAGARTRLEQFFELKQIESTWEADGRSCVIAKALPLVGLAKARVELSDDAVAVEVLQAPAFPSAATIQRLIVDELTRALA